MCKKRTTAQIAKPVEFIGIEDVVVVNKNQQCEYEHAKSGNSAKRHSKRRKIIFGNLQTLCTFTFSTNPAFCEMQM